MSRVVVRYSAVGEIKTTLRTGGRRSKGRLYGRIGPRFKNNNKIQYKLIVSVESTVTSIKHTFVGQTQKTKEHKGII